MRYLFTLIAVFIISCSYAETAVESFEKAGGIVKKSFDVDGSDLIGLVLYSPKMDRDVIAYTNQKHDFLLLGALMQPLKSNKGNGLALSNPISLEGLYSNTQLHYQKYINTDKLADINKKVDKREAVSSRSSAIQNGIENIKDKYNFLSDLVYVGEGNVSAALTMYILYDVACGYCKRLYIETRGMLDKYHFKWVPIAVLGSEEETAKDLIADSVFSTDNNIKPSRSHVNAVIKNSKVIDNTGFIEKATPTAIIFDPKNKIFKVAAGITGAQIEAFYDYVNQDEG